MATRTHLVTPSSRAMAGAIFTEAKAGIHQESATALHKVGTRMKMDDGRTFYYCRNSTQAISRPGILMMAQQIDDTEEDTNMTAATAIGAKELILTAVAAVTRSLYADGYMVVVAGTGYGQTHKIRDNNACHASGTTFTVYLYDELVTALDTSSDIVCTKNPFYTVARSTAAKGIQGQCMGINMIPLTASYYFWLQTWGWAFPLRGDSLGGDTGDEQILTPHASGISTLATAGGVPGAQVIGNNVYDSTDTVAGDWDLAYLRCVP